MKKLAGLVMAFLAVGMMMTSCSKDNEELILGTWNMDVNKSYDSWTQDGVTEQENYLEWWGIEKATFTFKEGGVVTISAVMDNESGNWDDEYTINGDVLIWDGDEFNILKLNKKKLILEQTEEGTDDGIPYSNTDHMEFDRE